MEPVYNIKTVNNCKMLACIGGICNRCGEAPSGAYHYKACRMPYTGGYVDDDDDYYAHEASASCQPSDKAPKASAAEKPSDKSKVRVLLNGIISKVLPSDLHKPKPFRTVSKGAVCFNCGAKEPMCRCLTDIEDDSDDDAPGAAASNAKPPGSFLPFF